MSTNSIDRWLPIPGYEGFYEVSDRGAVRSVDRTVGPPGRHVTRRGKLLKPRTNLHGYLHVSLYRDCRGGSFTVHRLVLLAFVGARPPGAIIRHIDGNKQNNRLENLCYGTQSENIQDRIAHGNDRNKRKTHCPQGHEYGGDNLIVRPNGNRRCRTCHNYRRVADRQGIQPAWTPADAEQLRRDLAALPVDTDDSPILRLVCAEQGIEL